MKVRLIRIGNSRGIRLPKPIIAEVGLADDAELTVRGGALVIRPASGARADWGDAAADLAGRAEGLLDSPNPSRFDEEEWTW